MNSEGKWITSSFYMDDLPEYIQKINEANTISSFLKGEWKVENEFTHNLSLMYATSGGSVIKKTPFGNTILKDLTSDEKLSVRNMYLDAVLMSLATCLEALPQNAFKSKYREKINTFVARKTKY